MPHKNLNDISLFQWIANSLVAVWAVSYAFIKREFSENTPFKKKVYYLIQDFIISGGTTTIVFMACMGYGMPDTYALPVAGFIGHKATRFSHLLERYIEKKVKEL